MLDLGVDAWNLPGDRRGIGRYLRAILRSWACDFGSRVRPNLIVPEWHTWTVRGRYLREVDGRDYPLRSRRAARRGLDCTWFPFNGPSWAPFARPAAATFHDASTFVLPGFDDAARATFRNAAASCAAILTDSLFSRDELARVLEYPRERIHAIHLGCEPPLPARPGGLDPSPYGRFALFVGEAEPRKGLDGLARALRTLRERGRDIALVVVGRVADPPESLGAIPSYVQGHVNDADLAALYRSCALFVYPSRYEGFGLPVLEAMSYGAPVVASNATAIPEAGGDAALYVPPDDIAALADAIDRVLADPALAATLRERGYLRAASMTWRETARRTLEVLEGISEDRRP